MASWNGAWLPAAAIGLRVPTKISDAVALRDFEQALSLDRRNPFACLGRGVIRTSRRDYDGAIADLSQTIKLKPDFATAYKARSQAWEAKGNHKQAEADRKKALSLGAQ